MSESEQRDHVFCEGPRTQLVIPNCPSHSWIELENHQPDYSQHKITKPAVHRLARRGGVKRISGLIYEET
ncbi:Histone H4 [Trichinella papuae]|uniref:Histone H4 n=1 Tax=Trichinella papuae TaxID=268474 RepID=A0A0V1N120_9BILA|nr:Histone H4 [Trichinella papuae]